MPTPPFLRSPRIAPAALSLARASLAANLVKANVPLRQDISVHVVDTFRLRTRTRTEYVVPLEVRVRDLPLDQIRSALRP